VLQRQGADWQPMDISAVSSMSGAAMAQAMFGATAQAASNVSGPADGSGGGSANEAVQVAVLQKALASERSLVNILA
jgi:hypothetical protein